jgi:predicted nucleic acid-binding protein
LLRILAEYETVLLRPELPVLPGQPEEVLALLTAAGEPVAAGQVRAALPHPDDLPFLEVAREADAILATGNLRHYPRRARAGVIVLSPREFLDLLSRSE